MSDEQAVAVPLGVGIHPDISEAHYHADPCASPSASSSILKLIVDRSPMHARWEHPRLNPEWERPKSTEVQQEGTILHSMILGTPEPYHVLNFENYARNKKLTPSNAAGLARDACLAEGKIPLLAKNYGPLLKMARMLRARIRSDYDEINAAINDPLTLFEVTIICRINGALCRVRVDCLPPATYGFALDLKFTSRSAEPEGWDKTLVRDHLFQADLYPRAIAAVRGDQPEFRFLVSETDAPYGVSQHGMNPDLADMARRKVNRGLALWSQCLESGDWPSYPNEVFYHEAPPWEIRRWETREYRDTRETPGETYHRLYAAAEGPPR